MNRLTSALRRVDSDLADLGHRWTLVGGIAVSARTEPRFTRDIDVAVAVDDDRGAERVVHSLVGRGYRVVATVEHDTKSRLATARMVSPGEETSGIVVDLLFASSGIESEIVAQSDVIEVVAGLRVPVARTEHLLAVKLLAVDERRPQDAADIAALIREMDGPAIDRAREALLLIAERGYNRERNLVADLEELLARS